jgi:uncharacterized protein (TIGR02246 family)
VDLRDLDPASLEAFAREYEALFDRSDAPGLASFYTQDARLIANDMPTVEGRAAIEAFWRVACARTQAASLRRTIRVDRKESDQHLASLEATVTLTQNGQPRMVVRDVTVWRREGDGAWRMILDISCPLPATG